MNTVENLCQILEKNHIEYKRFEHAPVKTSEEAAKIRGVELRTGVKAMLLKSKGGDFIMVLLPADKKIDFRKIEQLKNTKKLSFASPLEVLEETGCEIGGVSPFGHTKNGKDHRIKTYMDKGVFESEYVNFNAGDRTISVTMTSKDLSIVVSNVIYF